MSDIASGRVMFLQKKLDDLTEAYEEYITLLGEELDETVVLLSIKGWESKRHEPGKIARKKIQDIKDRV